MKILMVTMSMNIGGAETHILELCRALIAEGCEITLASFGGVYAEEAVRFGVEHVPLPLHTKSPASVLRAYKGLERLIREGNFDLVHAHARIPAFLCGLLQDRLRRENGTKFRFVTTAHLNFSVNPLWRRISRWGDRVMAVSDDIADYLVREYGYPREKIHTTVNGIDAERFSPETDISSVLRQWGLDPDRRRIVYMSRMDSDRADPAFRLLDCAGELHRAHPDCDLLLVGGGSLLDDLRNRADEVNRSADRPFVTVTGGVSNTAEYCAAASVFVGVSRSALEAMSTARPVILAGGQGALGVFDESKAEEAAAGNFCCRGTPLADGETLFAQLDSLLSLPPEELAKQGAFNRSFVEAHYTADRMARDYLTFYRAALADPVKFFGSADVVVSGYYGFGNLGDESLLDIISQTLAQDSPGVKIAALTHKPKADRKRTGLACISRFNVISVSRSLRKARLLISGGGSLLQDATSKRSLSYYAGVMALAERSHTKTAVLANGIGPIRHKSNRKLAKQVIEGASLVSVRDTDSRAELIRLGVSPEKIRLSADPAYLIPRTSEERLTRVKKRLGLREAPYFAVSLRPLSRPSRKENTPLTPRDMALADEVARVTAEVSAEYGLIPLLIPMQKSHDALIMERVAERLREESLEPVLWQPESAGELIGILSGAAFLIGMRLHAIIFASSAGIPVIGLSYDPKIRSLMTDLGQDACVELEPGERPLPPDNGIEAYVRERMANRESVAASLRTKAEEMRARSREDFILLAEKLR